MPSSLVQSAQAAAILVGVVVSVLSFNETRDKEAAARIAEARKPFLELRQRLYADALKQAGVLANPETHSEQEMTDARKRFRELYVAELTMVEVSDVETQMVHLAAVIDSSLLHFTPAQDSTYKLAHVLAKSFSSDWGIGLR